MTIARFIINTANKELSVLMNHENAQEHFALLPFEYLRISSPDNAGKASQSIISHKKQVQLLAIESVAKHGYRFIFDDQHSAIFSEDYLRILITEQTIRWQTYLDELKNSGHSREAMITIKQV